MNESTFKEFYNRTYKPLRSYICRICKNPNEADDIVQESYLRFLQRPLETNDPAQMKTTIYTIATRLNIDRWKRKKRIEKWQLRSSHIEHFEIEEDIGNRTDMMQVFAKLNSKERSLLWLAYVDGHSHRDIGKILRMKENSVRVLLFRARSKLAKILKNQNIGEELQYETK